MLRVGAQARDDRRVPNPCGGFNEVADLGVDAIRMAMPLVNPTMMGRGMNWTARPGPVNPRNSRILKYDGHHGDHGGGRRGPV